jgi:DNA repair exonuclease SbcCD ATPase subunit
MTRGRHANTAHLIATDLDQARDQWGLAFGRDRADLGPAAARDTAANAAAGYTTGRPLADVLAELRAAWSQQLTAHWQLERLQERLEQLHVQAGWEARCRQVLDPLETARDAAHARLERAEQAATDSLDVVKERATQHGLALRHAWDAELVAADHAAHTIAAGPGRLGIHRGRLRDAHEHLDRWEARWREMLTGSELDPARLRHGPAVWRSSVEPVADALDQHAQRLAAAALPEHAARLRTAQHARDQYDTASSAYHDAWRELRSTSHLPVYDTGAAEQLPDLTEQVQAAQRRVSDLDQRVERLSRDPAITSLPDPQALLQRAETAWTLEQAAAYQQAVSREPSPFVSLSRDPYPAHEVEHGPSIGR